MGRFRMRNALILIFALATVAGCSEAHAVTPAAPPGCETGPLLTPPEQAGVLAVWLSEGDGGDGCGVGPFNASAPDVFVHASAEYIGEARGCGELRARRDECEAIGRACGLFVTWSE